MRPFNPLCEEVLWFVFPKRQVVTPSVAGGGLDLKRPGRNCRKSEVYIACIFGCVSSSFGSEGKYQRSLGMMSFLTFCLKSIEVITACNVFFCSFHNTTKPTKTTFSFLGTTPHQVYCISSRESQLLNLNLWWKNILGPGRGGTRWQIHIAFTNPMRFMASSGTLLLVQEFLSHGTRACIYDPLGSGLSALAGRIVLFFWGFAGLNFGWKSRWFPRLMFSFRGGWGHLGDLTSMLCQVIFWQITWLKCPQPFFQRTWKMEVEKTHPG